MVCQHHRRYVWLNRLLCPSWALCLRAKDMVKLHPGTWTWLYQACAGMLAVTLGLAVAGNAAQDSNGLEHYRIVNGAIPEPLTDQPVTRGVCSCRPR
jgi:hypothetical protein